MYQGGRTEEKEGIRLGVDRSIIEGMEKSNKGIMCNGRKRRRVVVINYIEVERGYVLVWMEEGG